MSAVAVARIQAYRIPLNAPVGGQTHREGFVLALSDHHGRVGLGDCSPWSEASALRGPLQAAARALVAGATPHLTAPELRWCVELAIADLDAQRAGVPLWQHLLRGATPARAPEATVSALISDLPSAEAAAAAGYETVKLKLSGSGDLPLARRIREALPHVALRVDFNRSLAREAQEAALAELARLGVELVEEPGTAPVQRRSAFAPPCFADESVRDLATLETLPAGYAGVVIKPGFCGLHDALALARAAHASGREVVVTHVLESAVGRAGAAHVALALAAEGVGSRAHGLSHTTAAQHDVAAPLVIAAGRLASNAPGLGVALPPGLADEAAGPGPTDLPHPVAAAARARPDHPALIQGDRVVTWAALRDRVASEAGGLRRAGVRPGDVVAFDAPLGVQAVVRLHAITWLGAVAAPGLSGESDVVVGGAVTGQPAPERDAAVNEDRYAVSTSGTTGEPRLVRLGALQVTLSAFGSAMRLGHALSDRWHLCLPLDRVGGIMVLERCAWGSITAVLPPSGRFDAGWLADALVAGELSVVSLVPTQLDRLVTALDGRAVSPRLRALLVGGAPIPPDLCERIAHLPIARTWGMTETASQVATELCDGAPHDHRNPPPVAPLPFARLSLLSGPRGDQLVVEGPLARGRVVTRDVGTLDAHGRVLITGRADDTIISGGVNLDPAAIERAFAGCPGVDEALAVAQPDVSWGERPHLVYTGSAEPATVVAWGRARLPRLQQPESAVRVEQLPTDALGKRSRSRARSAFPGGDPQ